MTSYRPLTASFPSQDPSRRALYNAAIARWIPDGPVIAYALVSIIFSYFIIIYLNVIPPVSLSDLVWKLFVMLLPSQLLSTKDDDSEEDSLQKIGAASQGTSTFAAKYGILQKLWNNNLGRFFTPTNQFDSIPSSSETRKVAPPGLGNLSNSCYQNSIIQGLASIRPLELFLKSNLGIPYPAPDMPTHISLLRTIQQLNQLSTTRRRLWLPSELKSMNSWQQQDAQEYFSRVIEELDKEIVKASKSKIIDQGFKFRPVSPTISSPTTPTIDSKCNILKRVGFTEVTGPFENPLEGLTVQRVGCMTCGYCEGLSFIPFTCLTVPLAQQMECDVRDCLDEYSALEYIEGVECVKCTVLQLEKIQIKLKERQSSQDPELLDAAAKNQDETIRIAIESRLKAVQQVLWNEDFSEKALSEICRLDSKHRVPSTKSRQSVIARAPKSLTIHINRSVFDEYTGALRKNRTGVRFPPILDLDEWCLGSKQIDKNDFTEKWALDPRESMLSPPDADYQVLGRKYELRAVVTHEGFHDDGHYICYRKVLEEELNSKTCEPQSEDLGTSEKDTESGRWFQLSDSLVHPVNEQFVMSQGGVFMLFYEMLEPPARVPPSYSSQISSEDFGGSSRESESTVSEGTVSEESQV